MKSLIALLCLVFLFQGCSSSQKWNPDVHLLDGGGAGVAEATVDGRGAFLAAGGGGEMVLHDPVDVAPNEGDLAGGAIGGATLWEFNITQIHVLKSGGHGNLAGPQ
jgi:hypothetical protein